MKIQVAANIFPLGAFALPSSPSSKASSSSISSAAATPSASVSDGSKASKNCSANDVYIWNREHWQKEGRDMSKWYSDWLTDITQGTDYIDGTFAAYWGLGPSFSCDIDERCDAPQYTDLNRPDQAYDYEDAAMFLASIAKFNNQYSRIYDALDMVITDFGAIQSVLQQTFYLRQDWDLICGPASFKKKL